LSGSVRQPLRLPLSVWIVTLSLSGSLSARPSISPAPRTPSPLERIELGLTPLERPLSEPLTLASELLRSAKPQEALDGPLSAPIDLTQLTAQERKAWGPKGLRALMRASSLARRTLKWRALTQLDDLQSASTEARELLKEPTTPEATRDTLQLSIAKGLLHQLKTNPASPASQRSTLLQELSERLEGLLQAKRARLVAEALHLQSALMELLNNPEATREARDALWTRYGHTPLGERSPTPLTLSPQRWLSRGEQLFKERAYQPALEALSHLIDPPKGDPLSATPYEQAKASLLSAISYMRLRVEPKRTEALLTRAMSLLQGQPEELNETSTAEHKELTASVLRYQSILWARQGKWTQAMEANTALIPLSSGRRQDEARYQVGRLFHQAGRYQEATQAHKALLSHGARDPARVRWFLGWSYYRAGECARARDAWAPLYKKPNLLEGPQALYWSARCLEREGDRRGSQRMLKRLFKSAPVSYYGLLGRQLDAKQKGSALRWPHPLKRKRSAHLRLAQAPTLRKITSARSWRRAPSKRSLWEALALKRSGLDGHAREAWRSTCVTLDARSRRRALGRRASLLCERVGRFVEASGELWMRGNRERAGWRISGYGGFLERPPALRVKAYPLAFEGLTRGAATEEGLSPWWLLAHMLQESRFRPEVMSYAQAIGLMQILERTGKRISERLGWPPAPFSGEKLFQPGVALRLSAWYLKQLWLDLGHPILAMAAYNGGPMRMADHVTQHPALSFAELIEELGAHESRNYMRKVTDHTLRYLALYGDEEEWALWTGRLALPERAPTPKRSVGF